MKNRPALLVIAAALVLLTAAIYQVTRSPSAPSDLTANSGGTSPPDTYLGTPGQSGSPPTTEPQGTQTSFSGKYPKQLGNLVLKSELSGEPAFAELVKLHGRRIPLKQAYILRYENGGSYAKYWISISFDPKESDQLEAKMSQYLPRSGMYTGPYPETVDREKLYKTMDTHTGSLNYYWSAPPEVIWVETNIAEQDFKPLLSESIEKL